MHTYQSPVTAMCSESLPWNYWQARCWFCHIYGIWGRLFYACFVDDQQTQVRFIAWIFNTTVTTVYLPVSGGF